MSQWGPSKLACSGRQQVWPVYLAEPGVMEGHDIGHQVEFEDIQGVLNGVLWIRLLREPRRGQHIQRCNAGLRGFCYVCTIAALCLRRRKSMLMEGRGQRTVYNRRPRLLPQCLQIVCLFSCDRMALQGNSRQCGTLAMSCSREGSAVPKHTLCCLSMFAVQ